MKTDPTTASLPANMPGAPGTLDIPIRRCLPHEGLAGLAQNARVLFIRLRSMGDTILLTPALRMLHEWRPDLKVSVLLDQPWADLLAGNPAVDQVLVAGGKVSTLRRVRGQEFAAVINLHGGPTSAQLTRFSGAPLRIGMAQFRARSAYNVVVPRTQDIFVAEQQNGQATFHTAEHMAAVLGWLGLPLKMVPPAQLFPGEKARQAVAQRLASLGLAPGAPYAVFHAAALYASKQWSAAGFAEVARHLEVDFRLRAIFLGVRQDDEFLRQVEQESRHPLLRTLDWPVAEMLALVAGAELFLGNDSGPAHAAAALGVPVAVVFGSSSSRLWGPWRAQQAVVIQNHFDCNPCAGDRCYAFSEPRCILSVETAQVRAALIRLLGASQK